MPTLTELATVRNILSTCLACGFPIRLSSDSELFCACCWAGCPQFNEHFRCPIEARLAWAGYCLRRYGEREIRLFPGDRPPAPQLSPKGRNLFDALHQVDLAEFAARYTRLKPTAPGRWKGLCPIHSEKTPSFYVYADPWRWFCFGACATRGDIVDLARELKRKARR